MQTPRVTASSLIFVLVALESLHLGSPLSFSWESRES
ncbi:hypothetical protein GMORB2_7690 [Geosmithia morbida]|uniref:Uncharacterized protein n=1 Tax=Geosmithia morbida TaxID=1094350 RepID=A0A9P4YT76_9HYPO|nr:uncharacterized protein GMORB2_7690 [Geosmithia morbida]KAF4122097.1 hypothetical protein GMORB2_7690 [Geosmithia morbida]